MSVVRDLKRYTNGETSLAAVVRSNVVLATMLMLLLAAPAFHYLSISFSYLTEIAIFALAAYGVLLLYGYVNLLTFGHALFFGAGVYATTVLTNDTGLPFLVIALVSLLFVLLLALVTGYFSLQQTGLYFAILTLSFAEVFRFLVINVLSDITGGYNGLSGVVIRPVYGFVDLNEALFMYLFAALVLVVWLALMQALLRSQFGLVFLAIRENESRARALGYDTQRYQLYAFVLSGVVTGAAGVLYAIYLGFAGPDQLYWGLSAQFLFIVILGGAFSFMGSFVGAVVFLSLKAILSGFITWWQLPIGVLLILIILLAPKGIVGVLDDWV